MSMQREIKFRAWDNTEKEMLYPGNMYMIGNPFDMIWVANGDQDYRHNNDNETQFVPMQFTGLKDKNGKEIYDGDIVQVLNKGGQNGSKVVMWDKSTLSFALLWASHYKPDWCSGKGHSTWNKISSGIKCIVLGNIYEHPHLLTQQ